MITSYARPGHAIFTTLVSTSNGPVITLDAGCPAQAQKKDGFRWWAQRLGRAFHMHNETRIDHFRGFAGYWAVPSTAETAIDGSWRKGPGKELFDALTEVRGSDASRNKSNQIAASSQCRLPMVSDRLDFCVVDHLHIERGTSRMPGFELPVPVRWQTHVQAPCQDLSSSQVQQSPALLITTDTSSLP